MPDTVTVTETQGARYTWASSGFTWSSASAGKSWATAYPAVYALAVAVGLAILESSGRQIEKRTSESLPFSESRRNQLTRRQFESLGFTESYSDLIAYVLRWVESLGFAEGVSKASQKAASETFQTFDYLARIVGKCVAEYLPLSEATNRLSTKQLMEALPIVVSSRRGIGKSSAEVISLTDDLDRSMVKRLAEAVSFAETYTDLIAFLLRISESIGMGELHSKQTRKPVSEAFTTTDRFARQSIKRVSEAIAIGEALGRAVAYRRGFNEGLSVADALKRALRIHASEALALAEQYRRRANGVISDMIVSSTEITEDDFASIVEAGHPPGYTDFRDFIQGDHTYRRALFRAILNSRNSDRGFIDALRVTVDVPDIFDRGTSLITDAAAGVAINFSRSFRVPPDVTMTHKGGTAVAIPRLLGAVTTTGFTAVLENTSGTRVTGSFTWIAQGY